MKITRKFAKAQNKYFPRCFILKHCLEAIKMNIKYWKCLSITNFFSSKEHFNKQSIYIFYINNLYTFDFKMVQEARTQIRCDKRVEISRKADDLMIRKVFFRKILSMR